MSKPFKTIDEQIDLLRSRSLNFTDEDKAKRYLLCNNYYNVINYYSKFFMDSPDHYKRGTTFDEISHLYYFDKEIKGIFFKALLEIEKMFKSLIAYYFSEDHQENYAYLIVSNFKNDDIINVVKMIANLSNIIGRAQKSSTPNSIIHYINVHQNVPLWVLINEISFGQTIIFYKHMKDSEKNKIAKKLSELLAENLGIDAIRLTPKHIISYLNNICEMRNIVAHGNKFLDYHCRKNTIYLSELHSIYGISRNAPRQDIYNVFIVMRVFMSKNQFAVTNNSLRRRIIQLSKKITTIDYNCILMSLGFPSDWQNYPKLPQD